MHIIDPAKHHGYMASMRNELVETIRDPDLVVQSTVRPEIGRVYHRWYEQTTVGNKWVRVVVYFLAEGDAFATTAYANSEVIPGEVLWSREGQ